MAKERIRIAMQIICRVCESPQFIKKLKTNRSTKNRHRPTITESRQWEIPYHLINHLIRDKDCIDHVGLLLDETSLPKDTLALVKRRKNSVKPRHLPEDINQWKYYQTGLVYETT